MRKWRVGSISMGFALVMLGVMILLSQFIEINLHIISMIWIPVVLIILGGEIIAYIILSKQEQPRVQYDMLSILFIIALGGVALVIYVGASTGIISLISNEVQAEVREEVIPLIEKPIGDEVDQIIVNSNIADITLETNTTNQVHIFGTYVSNQHRRKEIISKDVVHFEQVGDKLYVQVLQPPNHDGIFSESYATYNLIISLPGHINLDFQSDVDVYADVSTIKSNWHIQSGGDVTITGGEQADLMLVSKNSTDDKSNAQEIASFGSGTNRLSFGSIRELTYQ